MRRQKRTFWSDLASVVREHPTGTALAALVVLFLFFVVAGAKWLPADRAIPATESAEAVAAPDPGQIVINEENVKMLVNGSTVKITVEPKETISQYWEKSGALERGFNLDEYEEAVQELNPERPSGGLQAGETLVIPVGPWPKGQG